MTKPMTRKVLQHSSAWTLWFAYNFMGFYGQMARFTPLQWCEITYNCLSLVLATYTIARFASRYFERLSYIDFLQLSLKDRSRHLTNIYLLGVLCVIVGYLGLSLWLDNDFFGMAYNEIALQIQKRSGRLFGYVLAGIFYGYHISEKKKLKRQLDAANFKLKNYRQEMYQMRNLVRRIEEKFLNFN
jgi:hypothetical protein